MPETNIKIKYNNLLARYNKLCEWDKTASEMDRVKYSNNAIDLMRKLSHTWNAIDDKCKKNMFNGFEV